jgi:hypothetical protein
MSPAAGCPISMLEWAGLECHVNTGLQQGGTWWGCKLAQKVTADVNKMIGTNSEKLPCTNGPSSILEGHQN